MPFLDHLEELRRRILWSLAAVVVGFGAGFWLVQQFQLVSVLKAPIAPYLVDGRLAVLSPTEPVMIVFKLAFLIGLVLASPIVLWQTWAFLSPGLYHREKRALVPALFVGTVLFLVGAALAYRFVVPQALRVLFSFQSEALAPMITYGAYFSFVLQVVLALGISFELPLVIVLLAWLGVVTPAHLTRFRRYAVVGAFIAGAVLSPGADLLSMLMMTVPLLLLYEVGFLGAVAVHRRRLRREAATVVLLLVCLSGALRAQEPVQQDTARADTLPADSLRIGTVPADSAALQMGQALDTATARRLGLPTEPSREFPPADSAMRELLARPGYDVIRYRADTAALFAREERIVLDEAALLERGQTKLQADSIRYDEASCTLAARGDPQVFDNAQVLVGHAIRYDVCARRGIIEEALTSFQEGATVWFLRGDVANDSSATRLYAASSRITSCDLPEAHYHFAANEVKWLSRTTLVARPVVLYVRDVPILWLPFIFQDLRPGRRSGILVPRFGINDIVRPSRSYNRQITNIGYYWAINDYLDLTGRLDWYSRRYVQIDLHSNYRWLNRFMEGSIGFNRTFESGGGRSTGIRWSHNQAFDLSTNLRFDINYASDTRILDRNAIDPRLNTQQITSALNFSKRYGWGTVNLGGRRQQSLSDEGTFTQFPALTITPKPIDLSSSITWSPGFSLVNDVRTDQPLDSLRVVQPDGTIEAREQRGRQRETTLDFNTPFRIGSFTWQNSIDAFDRSATGRERVQFREPDLSTPDPNDSVTVTRFFPGDFASGVDWSTGINLPLLFRNSWKLQPAVTIANVVGSQPFALRNRETNGEFVLQRKRLSFSLSSTPAFFAFFNGIGPVSRIRHSIRPRITYRYAPKASVPEEFLDALGATSEGLRAGEATQTISVALGQTFEGKGRPPPGDTLGERSPNIRKFRILSIETSPLTYDFEQAKEPGRTGWVTPTITNSLLSDLLPGFNLSLTHDLWRGAVGSDTAEFDPFLQSVSASFTLSSRTFNSIGRILGLGGDAEPPEEPEPEPAIGRRDPFGRDQFGRSPLDPFYDPTGPRLGSSRREFYADVDYTLSRRRPIPGQTDSPLDRQSLRFSTSFSPTPFWSVSWSALYNITDGRFESHDVRLERDLHEWRAAFNFVRNANGNFALYFSIFLTDLPDLKFDYDQTTIEE